MKYVKTGEAKEERETKFSEAFSQIEKYRKGPRFAGRDDIKFIALVFEGKGDCEARE